MTLSDRLTALGYASINYSPEYWHNQTTRLRVYPTRKGKVKLYRITNHKGEVVHECDTLASVVQWLEECSQMGQRQGTGAGKW